jgi:serine/threonine protein kinase
MSWIGRTLGSYKIAEEVGRGGMAMVYRAYQPQLERWVAIKILKVGGGGEEFLARFRREARAIAALRHPNILTVYDYGEQEGVAYIVMEYVPGGTLKMQLTGRPREWNEAVSLLVPVGRALEHAHSQGIVHRDVKPANVLLARPDWPLLADFGLAKLTHAKGKITRPGASLGTPAYLSPEQAAGDAVDERTDIYGLGVVLYELLTGQLPCQTDSPVETMMRRLYETPTSPTAFNPLIPPRLEALVMQALERDPVDRPHTMDKMVEELSQLVAAGKSTPASSGETVIRAYPVQQDVETTRGPRLLLILSGIMIPIPDRQEVLIGRAAPSLAAPDIDLEQYSGASAGVSRRHARLLKQDGEWLIEDLGSTNGTFLNEVRLAPHRPCRIHGGDHVRFGTLALVFVEE